MQPSYPGIVRIGYIYADNQPVYTIQRALVGLPITLFLQATHIPLLSNALFSVETTNDCNGTSQSITLTFRTTLQLPSQSALAFVVTDACGQSWLIGQLEKPYPSITATRSSGTPEDEAAVITYEVKHTAPAALKPCNVRV